MRRIIALVSVVAVMTALLVSTAGTSFAKVERSPCAELPDAPAFRQCVLLPNQQKGESNQAASLCEGFINNALANRSSQAQQLGGQAPLNTTAVGVDCPE